MRVLMIKAFARYARRMRISNAILLEAANRARRGLIDADLGGGLIKQRLPRPGQGRSGGFRSLMAYRDGERIVFLHVFAKSDLDNVDPDLQAFWRQAAGGLLTMNDAALQLALELGDMLEISYDA